MSRKKGLSCKTKSSLPRSVTISYGSIQLLVLIIISFWCVKKVRAHYKWDSKNCFGKIELYFKQVYTKRKMITPILSHLMDQATDIGTIIEFYYLNKNSSSNDCKELGVDTLWLFISCIIAFMFYRIASSICVYILTYHNYKLAFSQFWDMELFHTLIISYKLNKDSPIITQRYIQLMEATFESSTQALIQCVFLLRTFAFEDNKSILIKFSFIFSLWSIISRTLADDKNILEEEYQNFNDNIIVSIMRYLFRIFEVSSRIFILSFIWLVGGGYLLFGFLCLETVFIMCGNSVCSDDGCDLKKQIEKIPYLVAVPTTNVDNMKFLVIVRWVVNIIYLIIITVLSQERYNTSNMPDYREKHNPIYNVKFVFSMFIYVWVVTFIWPYLSLSLLINDIFTADATTSMDINDLVIVGDVKQIEEVLLYNKNAIHTLDKDKIFKNENFGSQIGTESYGEMSEIKDEMKTISKILIDGTTKYKLKKEDEMRKEREYKIHDLEAKLNIRNQSGYKKKQLQKEWSKLIQIIVLGPRNSGKKTILRQIKNINHAPIDEEELLDIRSIIRKQIIDTMTLLSKQSQYKQQWLDFKTKYTRDEFADDRISDEWELIDNVESIKLLWKEEEFQNLRKTIRLPENSDYFLDRIDNIVQEDYIPSFDDYIRYYMHVKTGCSVETFESTCNDQEFPVEIINVYQKSSRRKWMNFFMGSADAVLYICGLGGYDEVLYENCTVNRLQEALSLFEEIKQIGFLENEIIVLFFNKYDLFQSKIATVPITVAIDDYPIDKDPNDEEEVVNYILSKFEDIYKREYCKDARTKQIRLVNEHKDKSVDNKKFFMHQTTAFDSNLISRLMNTIQLSIAMQNISQNVI